MILPVTILYGSLAVLITLALALNVSLYRMVHRTFTTRSAPDELQIRIRAHGNAAEWLAPNVLALACLELQHAPSLWLHLLGGGMLGARLLHAGFMLSRTRLTIASAGVMYSLAFFTASWALLLRLR
jgi:uncharacterized membrane protein YecN with MAPEG domain